MLTSVRVVNFRCFRDAEVRLTPLTALVGPNASGKTALLRAISGEALDPNRDVWQRNPGLEASITWQSAESSQRTRFKVGQWNEQNTRQEQYLHLDPVRMREPAGLGEATQLAVNGSNLTNVIDTLPRRVQDKLARDLSALIPVLQDVNPRPKDGQQRLVFQDRWNPDVWYEPTEVSEGTILTLGLLALQYQESPVRLVAIEAPETGLHPYLLGEMIGVLRALAAGRPERSPLQIVLATQSAELLEFLEPEEVRFLSRRHDDGAVIIEEAPTGTEDWRAAYAAHQDSLGSLWLSGGLGGVPTG